MSVAVWVAVDAPDVVVAGDCGACEGLVGDDAGAVAEVVPSVGVVLVVAPLVLVALEDDEAGVPVDVPGDVPELDVPGGVVVVEELDVVDGVVLLVAGVLLGGVVEEARSGSHFLTVGVGLTVPETVLPGEPELSARRAPTAATEARVCGGIAVLTTSAPVVESKIPPAMRPIDTGRTRAKHM